MLSSDVLEGALGLHGHDKVKEAGGGDGTDG